MNDKYILLNLIGLSHGSYKNKYNRAQKLIDNWDGIKIKMEGFIKRGKCKTRLSRCAYAILMMMETAIRVGNEESADGYISTNKFGKYYNKKVKTYGMTTLKVSHTKCDGNQICLNFLGKKQVINKTCTTNTILIKYYKTIVAGKLKNDIFIGSDIDDRVIRMFVHKRIGKKFTIKDLRMAKVNLLFINNITYPHSFKNRSEAKQCLKTVIQNTADQAQHTPTVCKGKYLSPDLVFSYTDTLLSRIVRKNKRGKR